MRPGYDAHVNTRLTILAMDDLLDMVFHWSVFTHLFVEEAYIYLEDIWRALKPGGKLIFSFMGWTISATAGSSSKCRATPNAAINGATSTVSFIETGFAFGRRSLGSASRSSRKEAT